MLSGGELPALVLIDAVVRLLPGALGHDASAQEDSFAPGANGLLDHPHYTRPADWDGYQVPPVLLNGDHAAIARWRAEQAEHITRERRPDLLPGHAPAGPTAPTLITLRETEDADHPALLDLHRMAFGRNAEANIVADVLNGPDAIVSVLAERVPGLRPPPPLTPAPAHGPRKTGFPPVAGPQGRSTAANPAPPVPPVSDRCPPTPHPTPQPLAHALLSVLPGPARGRLALGPVVVHPDHQRQGLGTAVVHEALRQARHARANRVFVLGEPSFYARFGFVAAAAEGFTTPYDAEAGPAVHAAGTGGTVLTLLLREEKAPPGPVAWPDAFPA